MQIGEELCDRYLKGDYQYVLAVHNDKDHLHCHIIFNNTNLYNGLSFTTEHNQGRKSERAWAELRQISDEICAEHGLSVISESEKGHGVSHFEREHQKAGTSWKDKLRNLLREIISYSRSFEDFLRNCTDSGIEYVYKPSNKVKLKFRLKDEGQQRFTRADTLGEEFEPEAITQTIETAQRKAAAAEQVEKFFAARRARREAELALLNQSSAKPDEPKPTIAEPTESKALEKKEDVWASIRSMGKAEEIIAALEAVGITSYAEFTGFMFNGAHEYDHTDELTNLKSHIKTVETIIAKMKHCDELASVYKEYKGKSRWSQSRYKKKHSSEIEDYEQTKAYIKEHSKKYTSDGSIPSSQDMKKLLNRMKDRRDEILPEHKMFKQRQAVALQYTREVRRYINEQHMKREREKSRQRTQAKHKKNYLE